MMHERQHINGIDFQALIASNPMLVAGGVALAGWGIYELTRKNQVGKIDSNVLLLGGAALVAVLLLSKSNLFSSTPVTSIPVYTTPVTTPIITTTSPNAWSAISAAAPSLFNFLNDTF